jgi:hypothetical protein
VRYAEFVRFFEIIFMKSLFSVKNLCAYTMNYLHQEKSLRDQMVSAWQLGRLMVKYPDLTASVGECWRQVRADERGGGRAVRPKRN